MTLKLAVRIEGDASGLKPATDDARRQLQGVEAAASEAADQVGRVIAPPPRTPVGAPAPSSPAPAAPSNVVPFSARETASGLRRHEWVNLGRQAQDVVTMGAMGASPMQILTSQGAQVFDIFASAQAGPVAALKAVAPYAAAVAGLAATLGVAGKAAYDFARSQDEVEKSLRGIGRLSGASAEGIEQIAVQSADAAKVSTATAREMGATFASVGRIGQERFGDLNVTAALMGKSLGIDAKDAAERLAQALSGDVLKGAEDLNKTFGFLSGRAAEMIEKQIAMGDRTGAIKTATDALKASLVGATGQTSAFADAWEKLSLKAKKAYDAMGGSIVALVAPTPAQKLASLQDELKRAQADLEQARGASIDPAHLEYMRRSGYSRGQILAEGAPSSPGAVMKNIAEAEKKVEELKQDVADATERVHWASVNARYSQSQAEIADLTLRAKGIVGQLTPSTGDLLQLREWKDTLEKALATGQASSGTAEALERVKKLLAEGGREASRMREAAEDAFSVAALLPYQRALAEIELRYERLIKLAGANKDEIAALERNREIEKSTVRIQNTDNVVRDQRLRIAEQVAAGQVQRQSLFAASEAAATLAAKQELINEAFRNGQSPAERYGGQLDALAAQMGKVKAQEEEFQRVRSNIVGGMDELRSGSRGLLTGIFSDARQGKSPTEGIKNALGGMADRLVDRTVSTPITEALLGRAGKTGGGLFGDQIGQSGIFGSLSGMTTASMAVNAAVVNIGGAGLATALSGGTAGLPGGAGLATALSGGTSGPPGGPTYPVSPVTVSNLPPLGPSGPSDVARSDYATSLMARLFPSTTPPVPTMGWNPDAASRAIEDAGKAAAGAVVSAGDGLAKSIGGIGDLLSSGLKIGGQLTNTVGPMGWASGGWTGPGGKYTPAGVVHANEFVIPSETVDRLGAGYFSRYLPGYAAGGYVPPLAPMVMSWPKTAQASGQAAPSVTVNVSNQAAGAQVETGQARPNGRGGYSLYMVIRQAEAGMAKRMAAGRGDLGPAVSARATGGAAVRAG